MNGVPGRRTSSAVTPGHLLQQIVDAVTDVVFQNGSDGRLEWISPSVTQVLGYAPGDLVGRDVIDLLHPDDLPRVQAACEELRAGLEADDRVVRVRTVSGGWREVQARIRPLRVDGRVAGSLVTLRDEHDVRASRRALATVMAGNAVLVRSETGEDLLRDMCQAIVDAGGYAFCWYGRPHDDEVRSVRPVAVGGDDRGYVSSIRVSWDAGSVYGRGPTGEALRTGRTQVRNDLAADPQYGPWLDETSGRGIRCSISLPVSVDGRIDGALMVYAGEVGTFGTLAQEMLEGLAADLGYGLQRLVEAERRRRAEDRFRLIAESATDVVFLADTGLTWQWVSPSAATVLGWDADSLVGRSGVDYLHPDDVAALASAIAASPTAPLTMRLRFRRPDGSWRWVSAAGRGVLDRDRRAVGRVVSMRDISAEVAQEEALAASEAQFRLIAENATDVVLQLEPGGEVSWVSPSLRDVLGWDPEDLLGRPALSFVHPDDVPAAVKAWPDPAGTGLATVEIRARAKDDTWRWVRDTVRLLRDGQGRVAGRIDTLRDIDAEVEVRARLAYETGHDPLTGLPNRRSAVTELDDVLATARGAPVALLMVGVDGLKAVNDAFTHTAGERVLVHVADRLARAVGDRNRLARSGDNEFSVIVEDADTDALTDLASSLVMAGRGTVAIGTYDLPVTVSVGIAVTDRHHSSELVRDASTALHQALGAGGNRWEFLDPSIGASARQRLTVVSRLHAALANSQLRPWFQPIVSLDDGRPVGYEALVRWCREDGTAVAPSEFMPVAEQTGLVVALDRAVLAAALDALTRLGGDLHVAVNISATTLATSGLDLTVRQELARADVAPDRLHLEVTETSLVRVTPDVVATMRSIAGLGITWWVDDFGTGYSSISHLRDMPIGGLKLDRSFTTGILDAEPRHRRLAQGLIGLAEGLGLDTVAEGVETTAQAALLAAQGWRCAQGLLYGSPTQL